MPSPDPIVAVAGSWTVRASELHYWLEHHNKQPLTPGSLTSDQRREAARGVLIQKIAQQMDHAKFPITDTDVHAYYVQHQTDFVPQIVSYHHAVFPTEKLAQQAAGRLRDGETVAMASEFVLPAKADPAVLALAPGDTSQPIKVADGYQIIHRDVLQPLPLAVATMDVRNRLFVERSEAKAAQDLLNTPLVVNDGRLASLGM